MKVIKMRGANVWGIQSSLGCGCGCGCCCSICIFDEAIFGYLRVIASAGLAGLAKIDKTLCDSQLPTL